MRINLNKKYLPANDVVFSIIRYNENVDEKTIRFDTRGVDINGKIFTLDMQRSYLVVRHKKRTVYYGCREIAKQTVVDFRYEDLVSVSVAFVITNRGNRKVEKIQLKNETGEIEQNNEVVKCGKVLAVGPSCKNVNVGDDVYYTTYSQAIVPFRKKGYVIVGENLLICRIVKKTN